MANLRQSPDGWRFLGLEGRGRVLQNGGNACDGGGVEEEAGRLQEGVPQGDFAPLLGGELREPPRQFTAAERWGAVFEEPGGTPGAARGPSKHCDDLAGEDPVPPEGGGGRGAEVPPYGVVNNVDAEHEDADPSVEDDAVDEVLEVLGAALARAEVKDDPEAGVQLWRERGGRRFVGIQSERFGATGLGLDGLLEEDGEGQVIGARLVVVGGGPRQGQGRSDEFVCEGLGKAFLRGKAVPAVLAEVVDEPGPGVEIPVTRQANGVASPASRVGDGAVGPGE
eukprot:9751043-Lingulodinium_polyedra.AAC.1